MEVCLNTRDMDETHKKRRTSQEYFSRRLEVMRKERVKEKIYNSIIYPS